MLSPYIEENQLHSPGPVIEKIPLLNPVIEEVRESPASAAETDAVKKARNEAEGNVKNEAGDKSLQCALNHMNAAQMEQVLQFIRHLRAEDSVATSNAAAPAPDATRVTASAVIVDGKVEGQGQRPPSQIQAAASSLAPPSPALVASPQSSPAEQSDAAHAAAATLTSLRACMAAPHAVDAAGDSGKGRLFIVNDTAGRSESFSSLLYMPPSTRSRFTDLSADTDKRKEHDSEPQYQGKRAKMVFSCAGMQEAPLERHSADGGAASLVRQGVDAANAAVTLATMKAGFDPASLSSPDGPVNNTAAGTTHALAVGDGNRREGVQQRLLRLRLLSWIFR